MGAHAELAPAAGGHAEPARPQVTVPHVCAVGDPYLLGARHGSARASALRDFLDDGLARLRPLRPPDTPPVTLDDLRETLRGYDAMLRAQLPRLRRELVGLADGAEISYAEAVLLQVRRELIGYQRIPVRGDCTTYARAGAAGAPAILAQTVDLNGNLDDQLAVLDLTDTETGRRVIVLSFGGLLGYLGLNDAGLAIGLNLVLGGRWEIGIPPYLAIRHLLDACDNVQQALARLAELPLASSRSLTLVDQHEAICVEIVDNQLRVLAGSPLMHTNHYLHPDFVPRDELNVFARNSSILRLKAARAGLAELGAAASIEEHFALLSTPPIRVGDCGDLRRERTVAAVVLRPGDGLLAVRPGDPAHSATHSFRLGATSGMSR